MAKAKSKKRAPKGDESEVKSSRIANLVDQAIRGIEEKLGNPEDPLTIGDYLKLMQLQKEIEEVETPREIKVTWVEPWTTSEPEP